MTKSKNMTIEYVKKLGREKNSENFDELIELYFDNSIPLEIKREVVSSIGRQKDEQRIYEFIVKEGFKKTYMDIVYQMFRTVLYKSEKYEFNILKQKFLKHYENEVLYKMNDYYEYKKLSKENKNKEKQILSPTLLKGDSSKILENIQDGEIQFIFTSPPYYNARIYSDYTSYEDYLEKMYSVLKQCNRVLEDGRFIIINVSPVITKRPGREFESIRYPIHFDFHNILKKSGFYFVDEIIWIKPEYSVPNRVAGYLQTGMPLAYKPNCITESLLVYRKNASFLLDKNIQKYGKELANNTENFDTSNCWYISPKSDKNHPAVFPEELCEKVLTYYSFIGDTVLDPFAGSGTFGRVSKRMKRIPVLCELDPTYIKILEEENYNII